VEHGPILDVCTGTADLALAYWRASADRVPIVGADFCRPMLTIGRRKCRRAGADGRITLVEADAQR
ncbi:MAG: class I SAM-dependent methyltransferase, partial [Planctomycetales bacterium]|nr:class I SAM-dependent methyltransferase [Planctomycetales bacterium]